MKKTEMIEIMCRDWFALFPNEIPNLTTEEFIEEVRPKMAALLNTIERNGMLPPFNREEYYKTWRDQGDGYVWEKE